MLILSFFVSFDCMFFCYEVVQNVVSFSKSRLSVDCVMAKYVVGFSEPKKSSAKTQLFHLCMGHSGTQTSH